MGLVDDVTVMFGKGMNAVDKKTQAVRSQADLSRVNGDLEKAYAALGRAVLQGEANSADFVSAYSDQVQLVKKLEDEASALRVRIDELNRAASQASVSIAPQQNVRSIPTGACSDCGTRVSVDSPFCPTCGGNLADLKAKYRVCPKCHSYYGSDVRFCINCGGQVEELPIQRRSDPSSESAAVPDVVPEPVPVQATSPVLPNEHVVASVSEPASAPRVCPSCGAQLADGDLFCGTCGTKLV